VGGGVGGPVVGIICYGSLLSPDELVPFLNDDGSRAVPVRVNGFRRVFNQRSVWRSSTTDGDGSAVLNAVLDPGGSMNAVLVPELNAREYDALRRRERGYRMVEVEDSEIEPHGDTPLPDNDIVLVPTGNEERTDDSLKPIPEYIDICLDGARHWGESFYAEFLETTETGNGETLREYLGSDRYPSRGNF
jgi:hypothetical protein